ncbi:MAG: hypothetical protein KGM16_14115 [Bacteroidota bacterium]|nr:hypothetical protein [Bacteroidota bacterium]
MNGGLTFRILLWHLDKLSIVLFKENRISSTTIRFVQILTRIAVAVNEEII